LASTSFRAAVARIRAERHAGFECYALATEEEVLCAWGKDLAPASAL